jgi:peptidoglycan/xylan/chitin deacetylase (PgdA/CDA1 family)
MSSYHVTRTPDQDSSRLYLSVAALVAVAVMAVGMPAFARVDVTIDGTAQALPPGITVAEAAARGLVDVEPGDLVDVTGEVLERGAGGTAALTHNGRAADPATALLDGDTLSSRPGSDVREAEITTRSIIPIPVTYTGKGPLIALEAPGAPGVLEQTIGERSGKVVSTREAEEAQPMVLRRYVPTWSSKVVALSFDDGPWPGQTDAILDVLETEDVKGNFFVIGRQVKTHPDPVKRMAEEGHLIGNHSYAHTYLYGADQETAKAEIVPAQNEIARLTGEAPRWYRPAGGAVSAGVWAQARESKLRLVMWTVDPQDWRNPGAWRITRDVLDNVEPGAVVLLHDGGGDRSQTIAALPKIIQALKREGYTFVTLDELKP